MEYYNGTLCISHAELTDGLITSENIRQLAQRGRIKRVRRACYETPALFAVDSLPIKYKVEVYRRYPDLKAQAQEKPLLDTIDPDPKALDYYETYELTDGRHLPYEKQQEYSNNAAILNAFKQLLDTARNLRIKNRDKSRIKKKEFWANVSKVLPRLQDKYPHSLPENAVRLQQKYNLYLKGGYETLISNKFFNSNAAKVDSDEKDSVLVCLIADSRNLDNAQISSLYNMVAERMGWKKITASAVRARREKYELITAAGRLGETKFNNQKTMQVKRSAPTAPLLYWTLDGWESELLYQRVVTNTTGHNVTTYHNRLTIVVVLDPCVKYPVGYAIGDHETPALIKEALRNAVNHTAELFGQRYRVNQLQSDQYSIKPLTPLYSAVGDRYTPARRKNSKAKVVEPYFRHLNKRYCQLQPNWSGFGITTDPDRQPNSEALNIKKKDFPDEEGCRAQLEWIMTLERQLKREQYVKLFNNLPEERRLPMSQEQYLLNFGEETGYKNAICGSGLQPRIEGIRRDYDCFDIKFRQYSHVKWTVKYDPQNLREVLAVSEDGSLRFMLEEKYVQPMALADRKEGDAAQLQRVNDHNGTLKKDVTKKLGGHLDNRDELFEHNPELDILRRLIICDSSGQHKNNRSAARLTAGQIASVAIEAAPDAIMHDDDRPIEDLY